MAAQNTLQGSLFGEADPIEDQIQTAKTVSNEIDEISDKDLTIDAKERPRKRKKNDQNENIIFKINSKNNNSLSKDESWTHHSQVNPDELTPVLKHYVELKIKNPNRILLYRLGDFFECFFEDAIKLSQLLEITLTGKEAGKIIGRVPMAGVPHHAAERYCSELIKKGLSIAICDQIENYPSKNGGLIKREITRIITPGTIIEEGMLKAKKNNWLVALLTEIDLNSQKFKWGIASADISTGDFLVKEGSGEDRLIQEIDLIEASEIIWCRNSILEEKKWIPKTIDVFEVSKTPFNLLEAESAIKSHFKISTVSGIGLDELPYALRASGGLISYLKETKPSTNNEEESENKIQLDFPKYCSSSDSLLIDSQTRKNLELTFTQKERKFQGSLLWSLDKTLTAMGGRALRRWIEAPLINYESIISRQDIVTMLVKSNDLRHELRRVLKCMGDLERLAGRAGAGHSGGRDLIGISDGIKRLPKIAALFKNLPQNAPNWFKHLIELDEELLEVANLVQLKLINSPPLSLTEGGLIHDGVDELLDGLRNKIDDQNEWLKNQELIEKKISGISNLKLQYHRTFGYFLSVTKSKAKDVPKHWIRRQTLANEERFITPDLKERESKIIQLNSRAFQREYEIFCDLRLIVGKKANVIREVARTVARIDALASLAEVASINNYAKPKIVNNQESEKRIINIKNCRHPVVEQMMVEEEFIPNDIYIGNKYDVIILTGPNASGKSCFLRQVGLIQLLSQIGSWIPAEKGEISIADRIFTRVGAVDDLAAGKSTFIVEMAETAHILNQATNKSLVLLDEIGRGTSTYDGLSIAWAVGDYFATVLQSRTIFATHYHELNFLSDKISNVVNYQVEVQENDTEIIFLHKVIPGSATKSFGIEAAKIAGIPSRVIQKAKKILSSLEGNNLSQNFPGKNIESVESKLKSAA